jgi:putative transposase
MVIKAWLDLPRYDPEISLDEFQIMPDHFHGLIAMDRKQSIFSGRAQGPAPTMAPCTLPDLIQRFKSWTTWQYRQRNPHQRLWHRNYYERIIRCDQELEKVRQYIRNNPEEWDPNAVPHAGH